MVYGYRCHMIKMGKMISLKTTKRNLITQIQPLLIVEPRGMILSPNLNKKITMSLTPILTLLVEERKKICLIMETLII